jgi:hypothetical protein
MDVSCHHVSSCSDIYDAKGEAAGRSDLSVAGKCWMTNELMINSVKIVWNRKLGFLLNKRGMLVLGAFNGHLTQEVKGEIIKGKH